jgi:hypothetical protein
MSIYTLVYKNLSKYRYVSYKECYSRYLFQNFDIKLICFCFLDSEFDIRRKELYHNLPNSTRSYQHTDGDQSYGLVTVSESEQKTFEITFVHSTSREKIRIQKYCLLVRYPFTLGSQNVFFWLPEKKKTN